jgi:hypothetical protein
VVADARLVGWVVADRVGVLLGEGVGGVGGVWGGGGGQVTLWKEGIDGEWRLLEALNDAA